MQVTLVYAPSPRTVEELVLDVPMGTTLAQAVQASGWRQKFPELVDSELSFGLWGRVAAPYIVLRDRDRIEFYRPLRVDPKVARRERFNKQGSRSSGLFAKRRPGSKPGY